MQYQRSNYPLDSVDQIFIQALSWVFRHTCCSLLINAMASSGIHCDTVHVWPVPSFTFLFKLFSITIPSFYVVRNVKLQFSKFKKSDFRLTSRWVCLHCTFLFNRLQIPQK